MGYSISGINKIISLTSGTTQVSVRDLWSRWYEWYLTNDNSKYPIAFTQVGGDSIDATTAIPIYIFLQNGWKIKPQEANHTLRVFDGILVVDGGGDPFVNTIGSYVVRINYSQPVQAITVSSGGSGGGLTLEQDTKLDELHKLQGLDPNNPMTVTQNERTVGGITLEITGDGDTETIVTRI
jgi:hypothetical protein